MNGHCNLFIYKDCEILKGKNFKVDYIETYLNTLDALNDTDAETGELKAIEGQWMKHQLKLTYRIELKQTQFSSMAGINRRRTQELLSYQDIFNYNYLCAQNIDNYRSNIIPFVRTYETTKAYYFIVGKKWLSENSIELELEMDVVNTLLENQEGDDPELYVHLSQKSMILREHKDRWARGTEPEKIYHPLVDFYSEGLNVPLYKKKEQTIYEKYLVSSGGVYQDRLSNENYYLIYRCRSVPSEDSATPIDVLLAFDDGKIVSGGSLGYTGSKDIVSICPSDAILTIYGDDGNGVHNNVGAKITFKVGDTPTTLTITNTSQAILITRKYIYFGIVSSSGFTISNTYYSGMLKRFRDVYFENVYRVGGQQPRVAITQYSSVILLNIPSVSGFPTSTSDQKIGSINDIDRTDPKLLKILKLPYKPCDITIIDDTHIRLPAGWGIQQGEANPFFPTLIKYESVNTTDCFKASGFDVGTLVEGYVRSINIYDVLGQRSISEFYDDIEKDAGYESKLLHSDFFIQKIVYDSFSFDFKCEYIKGEIDPQPLNMTFLCTSTMNSKMAFRFGGMDFTNGEDDINGVFPDIENYSNLLYIARNNELPIYNSAYINYIRTGFNYDVKTKNRQLRTNIISGAIQIGGAIVSAVAGGPVGVAGAVALGTSAVSTIYKTIEQTGQAEQNIAQKLTSSEMQGLSVLGSDDVDLMSEYTIDNKAKLVVYEVSDRMKLCLFNLFHYCGYIANYQGSPNTYTRKWFNFVQCEPVFEYEQNFPQELIEELAKKYREGITYLHTNKINGSFVWDFAQVYENWESSLQPRGHILQPIDQPLLTSREYVIKTNLSSIPNNIGRITSNNKLTFRIRRKSNYEIVEEVGGLDTITINGLSDYRKIDVRIASEIYKEITFDNYASGEYYWTIQFGTQNYTGYNESIVYSALKGYLKFY